MGSVGFVEGCDCWIMEEDSTDRFDGNRRGLMNKWSSSSASAMQNLLKVSSLVSRFLLTHSRRRVHLFSFRNFSISFSNFVNAEGGDFTLLAVIVTINRNGKIQLVFLLVFFYN